MPIASLSPLVGTWDASFEIVSGPDRFSGRAIDTYRWLTGEAVLLHQTQGEMDGRPIEAVELFRQDGDVIRSWSIMADGSVAESTATLTGGVYDIDGDTERFRGRIETPDRLIGEWRRREGDRWAPWMTLTLDRKA